MPDAPSQPPRPARGAGGTPGGVGTFLIGLVMAAAGAYLLLNQVQVTAGVWHFGADGGFCVSPVPLFLGGALLFFYRQTGVGGVFSMVWGRGIPCGGAV